MKTILSTREQLKNMISSNTITEYNNINNKTWQIVVLIVKNLLHLHIICVSRCWQKQSIYDNII